MSRIVAWRRFIEVRLEDDGGRPVELLSMRPTPATARRFSLYQLLARPRRDGIALAYRLNPEGAPAAAAAIGERVGFSFTLHARGPDFLKHFLPDLTEATGTAIHLDNLAGDGSILPDGSALSVGVQVGTADAVDIRPRVFPVRLDLTASSPSEVEARDPLTGSGPQPVTVEALAGATGTSAVIDVTGEEGTLFRVTEVPPGPLDRRVYADDAAAAAGAVGVVDLYWETAQTAVPTPDGIVYRAAFPRH